MGIWNVAVYCGFLLITIYYCYMHHVSNFSSEFQIKMLVYVYSINRLFKDIRAFHYENNK